jgi:hypothetical protein
MDLVFPTPWPSLSPLVGVRECLESLSCESAETAQDRAEQAHHNRVRVYALLCGSGLCRG